MNVYCFVFTGILYCHNNVAFNLIVIKKKNKGYFCENLVLERSEANSAHFTIMYACFMDLDSIA